MWQPSRAHGLQAISPIKYCNYQEPWPVFQLHCLCLTKFTYTKWSAMVPRTFQGQEMETVWLLGGGLNIVDPESCLNVWWLSGKSKNQIKVLFFPFRKKETLHLFIWRATCHIHNIIISLGSLDSTFLSSRFTQTKDDLAILRKCCCLAIWYPDLTLMLKSVSLPLGCGKTGFEICCLGYHLIR